MFKFLKEKLKSAVSQFSDGIEEKGREEIKEVQPKKETAEDLLKQIEQEEKKGFFAKLREKFRKPEEKPTEVKEEKLGEKIEKIQESKKELIKKIEEVREEIKEIQKEEKTEIKEEIKGKKQEMREKGVEGKIEHRKEELLEKVEEIKGEIREVKEVEQKAEQKGFFAKLKEKIVTKKINESQFDDLFWNLEITLLENNVAVEVIEKIKSDLKKKLVNMPIQRGAIEDTILNSLRDTIKGLFDVKKIDIISKAKEKKPFVICFFGINGSGKTTTIAKLAYLLKQNKLNVVLAASDTFRAAAIDQLQKHADNLGIKLIKHDYGSDAAAVAFDAIKHAKAKNIDVVLIDTAGRMHSNANLMDEMEKIIRVANPDLKIFVGESITGNDCTEQAKKFNEAVGIDGIVLSKADVDEKGGAAISVSHVTGKPILYIGTGQEYNDLEEFNPDLIIKGLF